MPNARYSSLARYGVALACVGATAAIRSLMSAAGLGEHAPFLLFTAGIVIAAWYGGLGPGLAATAVATLLVDVLFIEPAWAVTVGDAEDRVELLLFGLQGVLVSWLVGTRREALERLKTLNAELERRVAARTAQLRHANDDLIRQAAEREQDRQALIRLNNRLEESNRELQDFASVASHDLQEPLRKIQAFGDRLSTRYGDKLEGGGKDYLDRMLKAAERMSVLINDLLTFARVTSKGQPFVPCDLNRIVAEVVSDLEARVEDLGGKVEVAELPIVQADPLQMRQLLQNLIGNGLKFRRPGVPPVVRVWSEGPEATGEDGAREVIRLSVSDNGIGFDEKYLDRIFHVFQRLHGRAEYEGTGIGLAVCRKIALRHGGDITATSRPGEGATFTVVLPVQPPGAEDATRSGETHYHFVGR